MGLTNLNMKEKTKWILVLVVKRRHRANGLFELEFASQCWQFLTHADFKNRIRSHEKPENLDSTWSKHVRTAPKTLSISRQRLTDNASVAKTDRLKCETTSRIRRASGMVVRSNDSGHLATVFRGTYCWSMLSRVKLTNAHTVRGRPTLK